MKITLTINLDEAKEAAKRRIDLFFANRFDARQVEAHRRKKDEAQRLFHDRTTIAPLIDAEAEILGIDSGTLALQILQKPDAFEAAEIERRRLIAAVRAATTKKEIDDVLAAADVHPGAL